MKTPALVAWRRELGACLRTATTFDALWRAASVEQLALEAEQDGLPDLAERRRGEARRIIADAASASPAA